MVDRRYRHSNLLIFSSKSFLIDRRYRNSNSLKFSSKHFPNWPPPSTFEFAWTRRYRPRRGHKRREARDLRRGSTHLNSKNYFHKKNYRNPPYPHPPTTQASSRTFESIWEASRTFEELLQPSKISSPHTPLPRISPRTPGKPSTTLSRTSLVILQINYHIFTVELP